MPHKECKAQIRAIHKLLLFHGMDFGFITSYNALLRLAVDEEKQYIYTGNIIRGEKMILK